MSNCINFYRSTAARIDSGPEIHLLKYQRIRAIVDIIPRFFVVSACVLALCAVRNALNAPDVRGGDHMPWRVSLRSRGTSYPCVSGLFAVGRRRAIWMWLEVFRKLDPTGWDRRRQRQLFPAWIVRAGRGVVV